MEGWRGDGKREGVMKNVKRRRKSGRGEGNGEGVKEYGRVRNLGKVKKRVKK